MNRAKIKKEAREILKGNVWNAFKPMLVLAAIYAVIGIISGVNAGLNYEALESAQNPTLNLLVSALEILILPISFGVLVYEVKLTRKQEYSLKEIFSYYKKFWPIFCVTFLVGLFTTLWTLLFIIPGIIAALSYSMYLLLLVDGEDNAMDCIKKSKAMMKGYKWDYFVFQLSFILWHLLGAITFGLAYIYVGPYIQIAEILYYDELKKVNPAK